MPGEISIPGDSLYVGRVGRPESVKTDLHMAHKRQDKSSPFYISDHTATFTTKWITGLLSKFLRI
jgi:hypothetical protein